MNREREDEAQSFTLFDTDPTEEEVRLFARKMGMNCATGSKYLYLAREALITSSLPGGWLLVKDAEDHMWWVHEQLGRNSRYSTKYK